jgi:lipopolysaccharide export system permease protein
VKILDRYILRELLVPFLLSLAALLFLLISQQMLKMVELLVDKGVEPLALLKIFLLLIPSFLVLTLPIALLISSISAFNRLSADYEIIALKSTGVGVYRMMRPVAILSISVCALVFYLSVTALPWSGYSLKDLALKLLKKQASIGIEAGSFNELIKNMVIYIDEMPTYVDLEGIFIYDLRNPEEPNLILAHQGSIVSDPDTGTVVFHLINGSQHKEGKTAHDYQRMIFSNMNLKFDLNTLLSRRPDLSKERLSVTEIKDRLRAAGGKDPYWLSSLQKYYRNYSLPFATFLFGILGVPLGIHSRRAGRLGGFAIGLTVVVFYYILMISGDFLVTSGVIPPLLAAWFPNIMLGLGTLLLVVFTAKEVHWRM